MYAFKSIGFLILLTVFGEILHTFGAYKSIRPYKFYRSRPSHRQRWHPGSRPSRWRPPRKRQPPRYHPHYKPNYYSIPHYENGVDYVQEEQPYTIEIEIPKRLGPTGKYQRNIYNKRGYDRGEAYDEPEYDEYLEDDYTDEQDRVIRTGKKKVRIKVIKGQKPKLNIRISRVDDAKPNSNVSHPALIQPQISTNLEELETQFSEEWVPSNPRPSYPVHLRGA